MFSKIYRNQLTELIESRSVELEEVLLHDLLSQTIQNESTILYMRVLKNEEKPWFYKIINYALFDAQPPKKYAEFNNYNQININAATESIISCDKLKQYLNTIIRKFISQNLTRVNPLCIGNFQRFIENFLKHGALKVEEAINDLIPFLSKNCRYLAIQQLTTDIIRNYTDKVEIKLIYKLLTQMLNRACKAVKYSFLEHRNISNRMHIKSEKCKTIKRLSEDKDLVNSQPLNICKEPIPVIDIDIKVNRSGFDEEKVIPFRKSLLSKDDQVKYGNLEDAEIEAYLLIMSIRKSISKEDVIDVFRQDDEDNYPLIQALFYCGTFCDEKTMISYEAFKILTFIFNGSEKFSIKPWKNSEEEKSELDFYNGFADAIFSYHIVPSQNIINALPIVWNHRYNIDEYEPTIIEKRKVNVDDYYNDVEKHFRTRKNGETGLELLQPCLLCEPPISSQLIYTSINIFIQLAQERKSLFEKSTLSKRDKDKVVEIDGIVLDFFNHHFNFGSDISDATIVSLIDNQTIIPLFPIDKYYQFEEVQKRRVVLNGFLIDLCLRMENMHEFPFFQNNLIKLSITKMGKKPYFRFIIATSLFKFFDWIDLNSINECPHKKLYFENEEEDDETKVVVVDEFPRIIKDTHAEEEMRKSTKKIKKFKPKISPISSDAPEPKSKSSRSKESSKVFDSKDEKIKEFESIFLLNQSQPNNDDYNMIDNDEEDEYHTDQEVIGEGSTSVTYKIIDKRTKVPMCKKVLKYRKDQKYVKDAQNALKEFEVLTKIRHPCICKAIGINIQERIQIKKSNGAEEEITTIAIFLEFLDFKLTDFLSSKMATSTTKSRIVLDIVHAMKFLHKNGMMHRDLKIENIMMNALFETKLVDFNLARINESVIDGFSYVSDSLTKGIGTLAYMSPEMTNEDDYDYKTDVYSFGVVLHFIFIGDLPKQKQKDKLNGKPVKLPNPSSSISKFCIDLIQDCMSYDPLERPSFDQILKLLRDNSYELAAGVDLSILSRRDKELEFIENYK